MDDDRDRWETCFHEAGHAIVAVVNGLQIRYISLKPRSKDAAAHVVFDDAWWAFRQGKWEALASSAAAGIIAQWLYIGDDHWFDIENDEDMRRWWTEDICKHLTQHCGKIDLKLVRKWCLSAWSNNRIDGRPVLRASDVMPVDLAVQAWRHAVWNLAARWDAVEELAERLYDSTRRVTYREVREILTRCEPNPEAIDYVPDSFLKPWFLEYSRLKWTPPDSWFVDVERRAAVHRQHESELAGVKLICKDCGCPS